VIDLALYKKHRRATVRRFWSAGSSSRPIHSSDASSTLSSKDIIMAARFALHITQLRMDVECEERETHLPRDEGAKNVNYHVLKTVKNHNSKAEYFYSVFHLSKLEIPSDYLKSLFMCICALNENGVISSFENDRWLHHPQCNCSIETNPFLPTPTLIYPCYICPRNHVTTFLAYADSTRMCFLHGNNPLSLGFSP
jgi:hypothetical protein